jgi:hydroxymethylpyrimidine pyrophosphatase-like HAD family hydrolase
MRPLSALPDEDARRLEGLLFDLDDTLLTRGRLEQAAYASLFALARAGLRLIAVTGRPSGWGALLARQWPIDGVVTENGPIAVIREGEHVTRLDRCGAEERRARRVRLGRLVERMRDVVPEARLTDDVDARVSDVTWDIGERVHLPADRIAALQAEVRAFGARTSRSSVHVHATYDVEDKASGAVGFLRERFGVDPGRALSRYAYVGDSGNDAPCFAAFHTTFGVANVTAALAQLAVPPRYVTEATRGQGFVELAAALCRARAR